MILVDFLHMFCDKCAGRLTGILRCKRAECPLHLCPPCLARHGKALDHWTDVSRIFAGQALSGKLGAPREVLKRWGKQASVSEERLIDLLNIPAFTWGVWDANRGEMPITDGQKKKIMSYFDGIKD